MIHAILNSRAYRILDDDGEGINCVDLETHKRVYIPFQEEDLIIDPTDEEFFNCENVQNEKV